MFSVGDYVYVRNYGVHGANWLPGSITKVTGPVSFLVQLVDGRVVRRHQDQSISRVPVENDFEFPMHVEDPVPEPAVIPESNPLLQVRR